METEGTVKSWRIFEGDGEHRGDLDTRLDSPPPWRTFTKRGKPKFVVTEPMKLAVNAALHLRRPLLLTGKPGTGKSSLIEVVAHELGMGHVLRWPITSKSTLKTGMYEYDALGRLQEESKQKIARYVTLGPLGTALQVSDRTRALLIDEIDKSDLDLPNDLLHVFERGEYTIPELERYEEPEVEVRTAFARIAPEGPNASGVQPDYSHELPMIKIVKGSIRCNKFPFIVLTSNGEREFPAAFLRRCIRLEITYPKEAAALQKVLREIVLSHLDELKATDTAKIDEIVQTFLELRSSGDLANDQLLNAVFLACDLPRRNISLEGDRDALVQNVLAHLSSSGFVSSQ